MEYLKVQYWDHFSSCQIYHQTLHPVIQFANVTSVKSYADNMESIDKCLNQSVINTVSYRHNGFDSQVNALALN